MYITSEAHGTSGTIDHILCPEHLLSSFSNCTVVVDDSINLSDHDPICGYLSCCLEVTPPRTVSTTKDRDFIPNWSKLSRFTLNASYTAAVDSRIHWLSIPDPSTLIRDIGSKNVVIRLTAYNNERATVVSVESCKSLTNSPRIAPT